MDRQGTHNSYIDLSLFGTIPAFLILLVKNQQQ